MALDTENGCRMALAAIVAALAAIGVPHRLRADRAGGRVSIRADPWWFWWGMVLAGPPLVAGFLGFLIRPGWVAFAQVPLPPAARWFGLPIAFAGVGLFAWMFRHLGLNVTSTSVPRRNATLVTSGPYRWVRHPMYAAALLLGLAASLLTGNLLVLAGGAAMFVLLAARSWIEEHRLVEKFGEEYRAYQRRTGRFWPRVWRRNRETPDH